MESLSRWVVRHRVLVGLVWLAITVGVLLAPSFSGRLVGGTNLSSPAYTANQQIARQYGGAASNPGVVVIDLPQGTTVSSPSVRAQLHGLDARVAKAMPQLWEISYASTTNQALVGKGGTSTILLVYPPKAGAEVPPQVLDQLNGAAAAAIPGATVHSTGLAALASGGTAGASQSSSVLAELLTGALAAPRCSCWPGSSVRSLRCCR